MGRDRKGRSMKRKRKEGWRKGVSRIPRRRDEEMEPRRGRIATQVTGDDSEGSGRNTWGRDGMKKGKAN